MDLVGNVIVEMPDSTARGRRSVRLSCGRVFLATCCLLAGPILVGQARAADYYVDGANPACSINGPGTRAIPYCSIAAALVAHHSSGTTLRVMPGVYHEQVTIPSSTRSIRSASSSSPAAVSTSMPEAATRGRTRPRSDIAPTASTSRGGRG